MSPLSTCLPMLGDETRWRSTSLIPLFHYISLLKSPFTAPLPPSYRSQLLPLFRAHQRRHNRVNNATRSPPAPHRYRRWTCLVVPSADEQLRHFSNISRYILPIPVYLQQVCLRTIRSTPYISDPHPRPQIHSHTHTDILTHTRSHSSTHTWSLSFNAGSPACSACPTVHAYLACTRPNK